MQMLSSTVNCPQCGDHATVTIFGPKGPDLSQAEVFLSCPDGHDVSREDALAAWDVGRGAQAPAH